MDARSYGPKLAKIRPEAQAWRMTIRRSRGRILDCGLWQEIQGSRGFYSNVEQIDRFYADDPLWRVDSHDALLRLMCEAALSQRLPGLD